MIFHLVKSAGDILNPAFAEDLEKIKKLKTGKFYKADLKLQRNLSFHRKGFSFFRFCFEHWCASKTDYQFLNESAQFDYFRSQLIILSGYHEACYSINGDMRLQPRSLAFDKMSEDEFKDFYSALLDAAITHIFPGCDKQTEDKLRGFF